MAVSDLYNECNKDSFKLDANQEKKICAKLLLMVTEDTSVEVKTLCNKCLAPLSAKISEGELTILVTGLRSNVLGLNKVTPETMDISSLALKFIINAVGDDKKTVVISLLGPTLTTEIGKNAKSAQQEVVWFSLDVVNDLLARWGKEMAADTTNFTKLKDACLPHLTSDNLRARKKSIGCLGYLSSYLTPELLNSLVEHLVKEAKGSKKLEHSRTYFATLAAVSRAVGSRLSPHVSKLLPLIFKFADNEDEEVSDEEVKDNCFQCLESILLRCTKEADKQFDDIEKLCLKFIAWDPLIIGDDDDAEDDGGMIEDDDFGGLIDDEGEMGVADDDLSWKVRKAAARCVSAIVKTRPEKLSHSYDHIVPVLIKRFKEREENVKLDIMTCVVNVLHQTLNVVSTDSHHSTLKKLTSLSPDIVKGLVKELTGKSAKAKIGAFNLLGELATVVPDALDGHVASFVPGIAEALAEKAPSNLKIEALTFLKSCMSHKSAAAVYLPHVDEISRHVIKAVNDPYYKITAEALRVTSQIIKILASSETHDAAPQVGPLYAAIIAKLERLDVDQEVKESAIESSGLLLSLLGNKLSEDQISAVLKLLIERISNEVTFLATVQTIDLIASSKHKIEFGAHLATILKELSGYLRKKNRQIKQSSLAALTSVVKTHGKNKNASGSYEIILKELSPLVSDQDLHLAHLALRLTYTILHASSSTAEIIQATVLPACHALLKNSLLQGVALESMQKLFQELVKSKSKKISYDSLLKDLRGLAGEGGSKQSYNAIAQCIAVLVAGSEARDADVKKFVGDMASKKDSERLLALYCVGEIGTRIDLTSFDGVKANILSSLDHTSEDVKSAASVCFGCVACGNLTKFLPEILQEVTSHPTRKYLLLGSLREVIVRLSGSKEGKDNLTKHFDEVLKLLFEHADHTEEGTRNIVSECLGKLALIQPETVVLQLKERTKSPTPKVRATILTALKYTIFEKSLPVDKVLKEHIAAFLELISDKEIEVRKAILISLNYIAHHKPKIISSVLAKYLPQLYGETKIKPELIVEIVLGPFKHKNDTGLELRQAAFECMYTLLDTCLTKLDISEYVSHLVSALTDEYDIQMLSHLILIRLSKKASTALLGSLEQLVEPLRLCVTSKAKDEAVAQQVERNNELIRSCLRAVHAINKLPDIESVTKFQDFMKGTVLQGDLAKIFNELASTSS